MIFNILKNNWKIYIFAIFTVFHKFIMHIKKCIEVKFDFHKQKMKIHIFFLSEAQVYKITTIDTHSIKITHYRVKKLFI